jgi:3-oxoadipate enol-lactonase
VAAGADVLTAASRVEAIAERIAGARLERIADCGHLSTIEQPEVVTRVLSEWLAATAA